ncbi:YncE family protein [Basilea psittacipulmonis]|uniref:Lipoprotein n=1 Tax=Basilea psittacipulmonis DSM 24701 TaxID=1072685 RepID=A0A077DJE2_9BURK|nr:hypothetical protein [Basilea psittacipulmonis]AIL33213.1 hypothetical protein IX83_07815 [Basilea psittacipulmonis DSM 24701]
MNRRDFISLTLGLTFGASCSNAWAISQRPPSLYQPTRYLFVADKSSYFITVIDIQTAERVDLLDFNFKPDVLEVARDDAMIIVGNNALSQLCLHHLQSRRTQRIDLPSPLYQAFFIPQSKLVAVALRDQVGLLNYETGELTLFAKRFDSSERDTTLYQYYTLLFSSFSQSFWVLDKTKPIIYHKNGHEPQKPWDILDFSQRLNIKGGLDKGVASPEDYMIAFNTLDGREGIIYFPETDKLLSTGPMYTAGTTYRPMISPYIDAYSKRVMFADVSGHMAFFNLERGDEKPIRYQLDFSPRLIRTGWLESTWIIGGDRGLLFHDIDNPENQKRYTFPYEPLDMWVTGDSKTLLMTVDEGAPQVLRFDIRTREKLDPIPIVGVVMGSMLRMGSNNSICY